MIHWGVYAISGNEWEGVSARHASPCSSWIRTWVGPTAPKNWKQNYDQLYKQFDPKDFNAQRWAKQAKAMGTKYVIFTTKHHDGFALWPTKFSNYNITQSPYQKDIVKQVVDAYTAEGIDVYLYFSVLEWANPDYMTHVPKTEDEKQRFARFLQYTRNQLLELMENYPSMKGFWFDGTWDPSWVSAYDFTYQLEKELRAKHPGIIIGSRFRNDEFGERHFDSNGKLLGDYDQGWERKLPADRKTVQGHAWDCAMTIPPNGWGYMKNWSGLYHKSTDDIIEFMMRSISMDGNFVLNFGPDANGNMHPVEDKIAEELGNWVKVNAEAIHGAHHSKLTASNLGHFTENNGFVYLTVFNRPVNNIARITIPKASKEVPIEATLLATGKALPISHSDIMLDRDKNTYYDITLPHDFTSDRAFVIKMKQGSPKEFSKKLMDAKK
jgi:alpha-L-fucosidase